MTSFSDRFNEWLIEQGKEPVSDELASVINSAAKDTLEDMKMNKEVIIKALQFFMAELTGQTKK